ALIGVSTPFASPTVRCLAGAIDVALLVAIAVPLQLALHRPPGLPDASVTALSAVYFILAYASVGKGYSPGKRALAIRVVDRHGKPLSLLASAVRWALLFGITLPLVYVATSLERERPLSVAPAMAIAVPVLCVVIVDSYLFLFNHGTRQSLHDLAAGSFVVHRTHVGDVPVAPLWRGHYGWMVACCVVVIAGFPGPYRWSREVVPRSVELMQARERILATHRVSGLLLTPGFATEGTDTMWYASVLGRIHAVPRTEHDAESLRLALACAIAREAPHALRGAELFLMISFDSGAVRTPATASYLVRADLTPATCASAPPRF
ncbi:MAG: RDD family protein, partial [Gemmatimonadales bacterium]